jgi:hypothetical protein
MTDVTPTLGTSDSSPPGGGQPGALRLILGREMGDLWLGGRLLFLLVLFAILMSATSIMRELESATSLIPPAEMIYLTLISTVSFGILVSLIVGADAVSGERERATLEPVLLAPVTRRQIIVAKYLTAISPWPVTLLISLPYVVNVSDGHDILGTAYFWTIITARCSPSPSPDSGSSSASGPGPTDEPAGQPSPTSSSSSRPSCRARRRRVRSAMPSSSSTRCRRPAPSWRR